MFGHFKRDCIENNDHSSQIVSNEDEDADTLVFCWWEDEDGGVSHLGSDAL
jgi:hypothetical protein